MDVNSEVNVLPNSRRKKGEGSVQKERQKRRSGGKKFINTRNTEVQAKKEPSAEVNLLNFMNLISL